MVRLHRFNLPKYHGKRPQMRIASQDGDECRERSQFAMRIFEFVIRDVSLMGASMAFAGTTLEGWNCSEGGPRSGSI
jgi:hypothetical protein